MIPFGVRASPSGQKEPVRLVPPPRTTARKNSPPSALVSLRAGLKKARPWFGTREGLVPI